MNSSYINIIRIIIVLLAVLFIFYLHKFYFEGDEDGEKEIKKKKICTNMKKYFFRLIKDFDHERTLCCRDNVTKIAFGSCNNQFKDPVILKYVVGYDPDLWIWLGDMLYLDIKPVENWGESEDGDLEQVDEEEITPEFIINQYEILKNNEYFKEFKMYNIPTIGTWDDHDYFKNNADYDVDDEIKKVSKLSFLQLLDVPKNDIRYKRDGIYTSYILRSKCKKYSIKIFLLDIRTFRTSMDLLGKDQWEWLEKELKKSCATINIIASGSQILANRKGEESWKGSACRHKIINMLKCLKKYNTIFISGDPHYSSIISYDGFIDVTSSSISADINKPAYEDPGLIGNYLVKNNFGFIDIEWSKDGNHKILVGFIDDENKSHNVVQLISHK